ncbi:molybdate ABC transporter substrate-binding protein [Rummeliibacillus sp. TYF005]|uniref:molybdate ABC transporter substrate-binding protein n=1 Tax=Rummeliibacillus sp. TYF005 TaxID=2058214 RepID=UPI000F5341E3|nr:molybdate ABC transporter substrate-binding protein [Rummeliibacillus sp. TYF005]RPJ96193.1 molybdate ABC transporter substrate-binding protein [Rummeliibacillus sp. TYF005]
MKKFSYLLFSIMLVLGILSGCGSQEQQKSKDTSKESQVEITVSAAASLQDALNSLKTTYEKEHSNVKITYNFGGSGALQQQISQGAPVDLFFSAAEDKFDQLVKEGLIEKSQGVDLLSNDLVLVVPKKNETGIQNFQDLTKAKKVALGTPEAVPAGQYATETLKNIKVWNTVKPKVVYAKDVRQVLTYVETGNVDAGIVYRTDAIVSKKAKIVAVADDKSHTPIIYPLGMIKDSQHTKETKAFYDFLQSKKAMDVFKSYGFKGVK